MQMPGIARQYDGTREDNAVQRHAKHSNTLRTVGCLAKTIIGRPTALKHTRCIGETVGSNKSILPAQGYRIPAIVLHQGKPKANRTEIFTTEDHPIGAGYKCRWHIVLNAYKTIAKQASVEVCDRDAEAAPHIGQRLKTDLVNPLSNQVAERVPHNHLLGSRAVRHRRDDLLGQQPYFAILIDTHVQGSVEGTVAAQRTRTLS